MTFLVLGIVGAYIGVLTLVVALCKTAARADRRVERFPVRRHQW